MSPQKAGYDSTQAASSITAEAVMSVEFLGPTWTIHPQWFGYNTHPLAIIPYGGHSSTWLEHKIVDLGVAGSIPVAHPILRQAQNRVEKNRYPFQKYRVNPNPAHLEGVPKLRPPCPA